MIEVWKNVVGYEGYYQVSNFGNVRSIDRKDGRGNRIKGKELKLYKNRNGYLQSALIFNGKVKLMYVHRIVAEAFLCNPKNLKCVNHKDENKTNNSVENLEWCDYKYNNNYGKLTHEFRSEKVSGENHPQSRLTKKQVIQIRDLYEQGHSITNLSQTFGVCRQHVWDIVKKIKWKNI